MIKSWASSKPILGSQIIRGHPFARGLIGCWLMNESRGSIVQDLVNKDNGNSSVWGTQGLNYCLIPTATRLTQQVQYSIVFQMTYTGGALNYTDAINFWYGWLLQSNSAANDWVWYIRAPGGNAQTYVMSSMFTINKFDNFVGQLQYSGTSWFPYFYKNGILIGSPSGNASSVNYTASNITVGKASSTQFIFKYLYIYNYLISQQQIQSLNANPYQFIYRPTQRTYFIPAGGVTYAPNIPLLGGRMNEAFRELAIHGGMVGAVMVIIAGITVLLIKILDRKDKEFNTFLKGLTETMKIQNDSFIAHNERAAVNHQAVLEGFKQVARDHERMLDYHAKAIMSLSLQDRAIADFDKSVSTILCQLSQIKENQTVVGVKIKE